VVLAGHPRLRDIASMFRAGASAYFVAVTDCDTFIKSLELVMLGETILPAAFVSSICDYEDECEHNVTTAEPRESGGSSSAAESDYASRLSVREKCILHYLIGGNTNKVIARRLDITEATVKVHLKTILRKIAVRNRTQAAIWAMNNGLVMPPTDGNPPNGVLKEQSNGSGRTRESG
jgi:DNA-binding NarL/FixJ family response regulator